MYCYALKQAFIINEAAEDDDGDCVNSRKQWSCSMHFSVIRWRFFLKAGMILISILAVSSYSPIDGVIVGTSEVDVYEGIAGFDGTAGVLVWVVF